MEPLESWRARCVSAQRLAFCAYTILPHLKTDDAAACYLIYCGPKTCGDTGNAGKQWGAISYRHIS
jgi:hypothetical protein